VRGRKAGARKACKSALISTSPTLAWNFMTTQYVNNKNQTQLHREASEDL
jgi:hypothetical protein